MWVAWTEGDWLNEGADGNAQRYIVYAVSTSPHPIISQLLSYHIGLPQALWVFAQLSRFLSLFAGILTTVYSILHVYTPVYYSHKSLLLLNIIFPWSFFALHNLQGLRRSHILHYSFILWIMILNMSVFIKQKKYKSLIMYSLFCESLNKLQTKLRKTKPFCHMLVLIWCCILVRRAFLLLLAQTLQSVA